MLLDEMGDARGQDIPAEDEAPLSVIAGQMDADRVRAALARLTDEQRQVIVLKFYEGLSNEEVASAINKPVGAVKALQHRALAALRRALAQVVEVEAV